MCKTGWCLSCIHQPRFVAGPIRDLHYLNFSMVFNKQKDLKVMNEDRMRKMFDGQFDWGAQWSFGMMVDGHESQWAWWSMSIMVDEHDGQWPQWSMSMIVDGHNAMGGTEGLMDRQTFAILESPSLVCLCSDFDSSSWSDFDSSSYSDFDSSSYSDFDSSSYSDYESSSYSDFQPTSYIAPVLISNFYWFFPHYFQPWRNS